MTRKKVILDTVTDLVTQFLWDDRKEDESLPRGAIEEAVARGEITVDEITEKFTKELREGLR